MPKLAMIIAAIFSLNISSHTENHAVCGGAVHIPLVFAKPLVKPAARPGEKPAVPMGVTLHRLAGKWTKDVLHAARKAHISPRLVASVLHVENRGEINESANRVSGAGAIGPMQLMPVTAWDDLRVDPWNPRQNIDGGARYLARLLRRFGGNRRLALIAYNAGPTLVAMGGCPASAVRYANAVLEYAG